MQIHTKASSAAAAASTDPDISPEILDTIGTISPEKQFTDQRRLVHKLQEKAAKTRYRRAQPLNETMMRQALDRVSDLHLWEGCQLIEMNPGLGIFSRLLHEKVKPSRHIMLEPNKQFNPILESTLIDNPPGGKENRCEFHLHNFDGYDWKSYQKIIELGSFNPVTTEPQDGLNKNILFVGNLAVKGQDGDRLLTQIVEAMGSGQWIHQYGRVRMLIWIQNHIKIRFLPRAMKDRTRVTATTEIVTDIYELAGAGGPGEDSHWASVVTESLAKLEKNLQELEEARRLQAEQAMKDPEAAARMEEERKQKLKALDGGSKTLAAATIRQRTYTVHDRENFVGRDRKAELEAMYQDPDHEPWTPELEHPPWLYTDPHSPLQRPPKPAFEGVKPSTSGRRRKDGTTGKPELITEAKQTKQSLTKALRRLPLPDEFVLENGKDAWTSIEAYKHQKVLDAALAKWDEEVSQRNVLPPPEDEIPLSTRVGNVKNQYISAERAREMGYQNLTMAKAGIILAELERKFGDPELAWAWMKALGTASRKRVLIEVLEEELAGRPFLQWHKRKVEPVRTTPEDVHPMESVSLLDLQPKVLPEWLAGPEVEPRQRQERWDLLNHVLRNLFVLRASPIKESFATLSPGAEMVLEEVPGLQGKGGNMRTRMISGDMLVKLTERYEVWPYRDKLSVWEDRTAGLLTNAEGDIVKRF